MNPVAITAVLIVAFAAFAALAWRKLAIVAALRPEVRWDRPNERLRQLWVQGLLQSRMVRGDPKAGVMHVAIFIGFLLLLARKVQLIAIGYDEHFVYPGLLGDWFTVGKDLVEVAVLVAVGYGFWRRFVRRPVRLEPNREAIVVLSLISAIMLTDFAFDGFRFARFARVDAGIAHEAAFAPVGALVAAALDGLSAQALAIGYHAFYWTQMLTVLSFLVILPLGEHFHIVTALPALYFARGRPANRVPSVDLDAVMNAADGDTISVGARTARDLTWKEGFDAFTCTECGRCKTACPAFVTGQPLSQKWVNDSVKHHLIDVRAALVHDASAEVPALVPDIISEEALWACTTCGYCEEACPIELEHLPRFYRLRQERVMMQGAFPHELKVVFDGYEAQSNPWALPADTRGDWARSLDIPVVSSADEVRELDWLFYVGSAASFDPRGQKIATAFANVLKRAGVRFGILGAAETSTGECVRRLGNEMLFQSLAQPLVETLNGLGVKRIVTTDPHAFNTLKNEYPEFGGHYEVLHHTQLIARLIAEGRLAPASTAERVIYHEPCYLARHNGEYEAPRAVLRDLCADVPLEFELNREQAMCCGAGGGRMWLEERSAKRMNVVRVEQALGRGPRIIATGCPYCAVMMGDGLKSLGREEDVHVKDIAELVAEALPAS